MNRCPGYSTTLYYMYFFNRYIILFSKECYRSFYFCFNFLLKNHVVFLYWARNSIDEFLYVTKCNLSISNIPSKPARSTFSILLKQTDPFFFNKFQYLARSKSSPLPLNYVSFNRLERQLVAKVVETSYLNERKLFTTILHIIFLPSPLPNVATYAIWCT